MDLSHIGPVGVRRFQDMRLCDAHQGHEHNYDHATVIVSGRVRVSRQVVEDGKVVDRETTEHGPGDVIAIPAKMRHTLKALENGTSYLCIFSHRDFDGLVTQGYTGNVEAYR